MGKAFVLEDMDLAVGRWQVPPEAVKAEVSRFRLAVADTRKEMIATQQKILKLLGKTHARLIEAYLLILEDPLISKDVVKNITTNRVNAEYALSEAVAGAVKTLEAATDEYFRERRHDVLDVGRKILLHLLGHQPQDLEDLNEPSVIVARNLTPSDTIHMKAQFAEGFATDIGRPHQPHGHFGQLVGNPGGGGPARNHPSRASGRYGHFGRNHRHRDLKPPAGRGGQLPPRARHPRGGAAGFGTIARSNGPNHRRSSHRVGGQHRFARRD
jgi:hypothetical protein